MKKVHDWLHNNLNTFNTTEGFPETSRWKITCKAGGSGVWALGQEDPWEEGNALSFCLEVMDREALLGLQQMSPKELDTSGNWEQHY